MRDKKLIGKTRSMVRGTRVARHASLIAAFGCASTLLACSAENADESTGAESLAVVPSPIVDARRSLAITEQPILVNFGLDRVLNQLITSGSGTGQTATSLFQQWWDTQNPGPGLGAGPHCDDVVSGGTPLVNGYPYLCRPAPAEGAQAACDPFAANSTCAYMPIGLFMRSDQAPANGDTCGQYRIVYAKTSGRTETQNRNLLIFEAALPNPHLNQGIRGCEKFVRAWAELSLEPSLDKRRIQLEQFYFDGYKEYAPVVSYQNFGDNPFGAGQIRTNSFVQPDAPRIWTLREFKLAKSCTPQCKVQFVPASDKVNPFGPLFDPASTHANAPGFQAEFLTQVPALAAADPNEISMNTSDLFNSPQSQATSSSNETNYPANFGTGPSPFRTNIQNALTSIGSALTPDDIVKRAQVNACAGCPRSSTIVDLGGGVIWPPSLGFTHISERDADLETVDAVTRFKLSDALVNLLLPRRKALVEDFLNNVPLPSRPPKAASGGGSVHWANAGDFRRRKSEPGGLPRGSASRSCSRQPCAGSGSAGNARPLWAGRSAHEVAAMPRMTSGTTILATGSPTAACESAAPVRSNAMPA